MRYNDTLSAANVAFGTTRERADSRIAQALNAGRLLCIHTRARLPEDRCAIGVPRGPFRLPPTDGPTDHTLTARVAVDGQHQCGRLWRHMLSVSCKILLGRIPSNN